MLHISLQINILSFTNITENIYQLYRKSGKEKIQREGKKLFTPFDSVILVLQINPKKIIIYVKKY